MTALACSYLWWPNIDKVVQELPAMWNREAFANSCTIASLDVAIEVVGTRTHRFCGIFSRYYAVLVDAHSKWPVYPIQAKLLIFCDRLSQHTDFQNNW